MSDKDRPVGTSDEREYDDGAPAGGVGTIVRPAAPEAPPRVPPRRTRRPRRLGQPRDPSEPEGRPAVWTEERGAQRQATREDGGRLRADERDNHARRMPFVLLLCVLLGGALISALVISTTLAQGSFQISKLQQSNKELARQRQILQENVAAAQSAQVIQARALQLGMRPAGELRFLNLKTGTVQTDAGSGAVAAIHVPGYTP
jgi:cell division protein FtsB